jgi:hypothetical protein
VQLFDRGVALWSGLSRKGKRRVIFVVVVAAIWIRCEFKPSSDSESKRHGSAAAPASSAAPSSDATDEDADGEKPAKPASPTAAPAVVTKHENPTSDRTYAVLKVESDPPGAEILLDNTPTRKRTPADLRLERGKHTVEVLMHGFMPASASFAVKGGEQMEYSPHLNVAMGSVNVPNIPMPDTSKLEGLTKEAQANAWKEWGQAQSGNAHELVINSNPPGAKILVDGKDTGKTTPAVIPMAPATYHVRVELDGFLPDEKELTVGDHKPGIANFKLKVNTAD